MAIREKKIVLSVTEKDESLVFAFACPIVDGGKYVHQMILGRCELLFIRFCFHNSLNFMSEYDS